MAEKPDREYLFHHHHHGHEEGAWEEPADPASKSLSDAMQVSFRILSIIMIGVVAAFLLTGIRSIEQNQLGVVKLLGRYVRTAQPGLAYNWPWPVGEIEVVEVADKSLDVDAFWFHVPPQYKLTPLAEMPIPPEGLRPGWDGALLTGDRNLLHVKIKCIYNVTQAVEYLRNIRDPEKLIRYAICNAANLEAGKETAQGIQLTRAAAFADNVMGEAQRQLDKLTGGPPEGPRVISISQITLSERTWPLRARPAYQAAQNASQELQAARSDALKDARDALLSATGRENYTLLVGVPWEPNSGERIREDRDIAPEDWDLIGQYTDARESGDEARAAQLLERISSVLVASKGEVSRIIEEAETQRGRILSKTQSRVGEFEKLLVEYRRNPGIMRLNRLQDVRDAIFQAATNAVMYLPMENGKTILYLNRYPEIVRQLLREETKAQEQGDTPQGGGN